MKKNEPSGDPFTFSLSWVCLLVLACASLAYWGALRHPFLIDDQWIILNDPRVQQLQWGELLAKPYWPLELGGSNQVYRPLTSVSLAMNWAISHEPWTFRLVNLLLHALAGLAIFLLGRDLLRNFWVGLGAALFFICHPIHTTPLNQIIDRADLGAAVCGLFALWFFARDYQTEWKKGHYPVLAGLLAALAMLFKENAVTLLGLLLIVDITLVIQRKHAGIPVKSVWKRRIWRGYLPLLLITGLYLFLRGNVLGELSRSGGSVALLDNIIAQPQFDLNPGESTLLPRWGTPLALLTRSAGLLIWPAGLSWDYSYAAIPLVKKISDARFLIGMMILVAIVLFLVLSWRGQGKVFFCLGFFVCSYSIVSNTVVIIGSAFAERYLYFPAAGFCLLGAVICESTWQKIKSLSSKKIYCWSFLILVLLAGLGYLRQTIIRNGDFSSAQQLNLRDLKSQPKSARLWTSVASDYLMAGSIDAAIAHAEKSMIIYPGYPVTWNILALGYLSRGDPAKAGEILKKIEAVRGLRAIDIAVDFAATRMDQGLEKNAITILGVLVQIHPESPTIHNNLAWYLLTCKDSTLRAPERALAHAREAVRLEPGAGMYWDTYLAVLDELKMADELRLAVSQALEKVPPADQYYESLRKRLQK